MSPDLMDRGQILQIHRKAGAVSPAQIRTEARRTLSLYPSDRYPGALDARNHPLGIDFPVKSQRFFHESSWKANRSINERKESISRLYTKSDGTIERTGVNGMVDKNRVIKPERRVSISGVRTNPRGSARSANSRGVPSTCGA